MEERNFEQRCAIKFCVKLGEIGIETFNKMKQAYGECTPWYVHIWVEQICSKYMGGQSKLICIIKFKYNFVHKLVNVSCK